MLADPASSTLYCRAVREACRLLQGGETGIGMENMGDDCFRLLTLTFDSFDLIISFSRVKTSPSVLTLKTALTLTLIIRNSVTIPVGK